MAGTPGMGAQRNAFGVGASLLRKEDDRYMRGRGQFVGDIQRPGMLEVAFVRSPIAHGRILGIEKPVGCEDRVFTMRDMEGVKPIRAVSSLKGFNASNLWPLARDKVRHVGESVAMCVAATRVMTSAHTAGRARTASGESTQCVQFPYTALRRPLIRPRSWCWGTQKTLRQGAPPPRARPFQSSW